MKTEKNSMDLTGTLHALMAVQKYLQTVKSLLS